MAGLLVVLEGQEYSGKTTTRDALAKLLTAKGYEVECTREPGGTPEAEELREWLFAKKGTITPMTELLVFQAARAEHVEKVILPAIAAGKIVLCDRFWLSTYCIQVYPFISEENADLLGVFGETLRPIIAPIGEMMQLFIDVPKAVRDERHAAIGSRNSFDDMPEARAKAIEDAYEIMRTSGEVQVVNGNRSIEEVAAECALLIDDGLQERDAAALNAQAPAADGAAPAAAPEGAAPQDTEEEPPLPPFEDFVAESITQAFSQVGLPMLLDPKTLKAWKDICQKKSGELRKKVLADGQPEKVVYQEVHKGMQWMAQVAHSHEMGRQFLEANAPTKAEQLVARAAQTPKPQES